MRSILLVVLLTPFLHAQEAARTCRTLFLNGPEQQTEVTYYLFDGAQCQKVQLPRLSLSPVYQIHPASRKLWLLTKHIGKLEELPQGAPQVMVPAATMDFYLLISRDPSNATLPLKMHVINANNDRIGRGEMLWFNMTTKDIAGKIGKSTLRLTAESSQLVKEPANDLGDYPVEIYFCVPGDERTHPLIESQWRHDPRARRIVFVYNEGKRRTPRIKSFTDFRITEPPKEE